MEMLYLFRLQRNSKTSIYHIFDTHTESIIHANNELILKIIHEYRMEIKNLYADNRGIQLKKWPRANISNRFEENIDIALNCILIGKVGKQKFKIINNEGKSKYVEEDFLKRYVKAGRIANCDYLMNGEIEEYKSIDTCSIETDSQFVNNINQEYKKFKAKANMLGVRATFDYTVEGRDVKLINCRENGSKVIVPNFITTICTAAFQGKGIQELILNNGLKHIGIGAFSLNNLNHVDIPETVEFIGDGAFDYNSKQQGKLIYKKLNTNTIIIE